MKAMNTFVFGAIMLMGFAGAAQAGPALKAGNWTFTFYQGPSQTTASTKSLCLSAGHTWHIAGPLNPMIPGNGGWSQDGNNINLYGTIGEAIQGAAFSVDGQMIGASLVTGQYKNFNVVQPAPNGSYGVFKAVFNGAVCPL
jgi:hypothetical protein